MLEHLDEPYAPMVYATVPPQKLREIQQQFGGDKASHAIENTFAQLAQKLKQHGVKNFITAGGETSVLWCKSWVLTVSISANKLRQAYLGYALWMEKSF